jgi:23S rRNA pseudouridine2605 synthase
MDLLPKELSHLKPVGRLDYESEGLLLLSNDGNLIFKSTHPKYEKQKEYRMVFKKPVSKDMINAFQKGVHLAEGLAKADSVKLIEKNEVEVTIHQGWNRQLRRMAEKCHYDVVKLIRTRMGNIELENLKSGEWREIQTI